MASVSGTVPCSTSAGAAPLPAPGLARSCSGIGLPRDAGSDPRQGELPPAVTAGSARKRLAAYPSCMGRRAFEGSLAGGRAREEKDSRLWNRSFDAPGSALWLPGPATHGSGALAARNMPASQTQKMPDRSTILAIPIRLPRAARVATSYAVIVNSTLRRYLLRVRSLPIDSRFARHDSERAPGSGTPESRLLARPLAGAYTRGFPVVSRIAFRASEERSPGFRFGPDMVP